MEQMLRRITVLAHEAEASGSPQMGQIATRLHAIVDEFDHAAAQPAAADDDQDDHAPGDDAVVPDGRPAGPGLKVTLSSPHGLNALAVRRVLARTGLPDVIADEPTIAVTDDGRYATATFHLADEETGAVDRLLGPSGRMASTFSGATYVAERDDVPADAGPAPAAPAAPPAAVGEPDDGMTLHCTFWRQDGDALTAADTTAVIGAAQDHLQGQFADLQLRGYRREGGRLTARMHTSACSDQDRQDAVAWGPSPTDIPGVGMVMGNCVEVT